MPRYLVERTLPSALPGTAADGRARIAATQ